jgi:hypothetical protein
MSTLPSLQDVVDAFVTAQQATRAASEAESRCVRSAAAAPTAAHMECLEDDIRIATNKYLDWLGGDRDDARTEAVAALRDSVEVHAEQQRFVARWQRHVTESVQAERNAAVSQKRAEDVLQQYGSENPELTARRSWEWVV